MGREGSRRRDLEFAAVIGPMQHRLTLARAAGEIAAFAILFDLADVMAYGLPAGDLAGVVFHATAQIIAAIPLKPAAWIIDVNPAIAPPHRKRLAGVTPKKFSLGSRLARASLAWVNQLLGNSPVQSVRYFPAKTPSASISFGVSSGLNSGSKLRPSGSVSA